MSRSSIFIIFIQSLAPRGSLKKLESGSLRCYTYYRRLLLLNRRVPRRIVWKTFFFFTINVPMRQVSLSQSGCMRRVCQERLSLMRGGYDMEQGAARPGNEQVWSREQMEWMAVVS
jgi:hypothetical protein